MGILFDIKRYAIHDGPGIRVTVFLKGCPLSCVWCHNPEGILPGPEKMYTSKKCIGCSFCIRSCPVGALSLSPDGIITDSRLCTVCGNCADNCPAKAMEISGMDRSVEEVMTEIRKEILFMEQSGGGVTFCGGEPLRQKEFLLSLLKKCGEEGIHRTVDSTLFAAPETVRQVVNHTDLFLIDLKIMNSAKHRYYCGVPNEGILENIRRIAETGTPFYIRIPLVEGINTDEENIMETARFLGSLDWREKRVELLPYHDIATTKHQKLGTIYNPDRIQMEAPSEERMEEIRRIFISFGIQAITG